MCAATLVLLGAASAASAQDCNNNGLDDAAELGNGLVAEYFNNPDTSGTPVLKRIDSNIDFDYSFGSPDPSINIDNFSARWTGALHADYSETYTIRLVHDDNVRLRVNGVEVVNAIGVGITTGSIALEAGSDNPIVLEFREDVFTAYIHLYWESLSIAEEIIPSDHLSPAISVDCNGNSIPDECEASPVGENTTASLIMDQTTTLTLPVTTSGAFTHDLLIAAPPTTGTLAQLDGTPIVDDLTTVTDPAGQVLYTPAAGETGLPYDTFEYVIVTCATTSTAYALTVYVSPDCNSNSTPDYDELLSGVETDCDGNGTLDSCDIANDGTLDCNSNNVLDSCDLANSTSQDVNQSGRPDECESADLTTTLTVSPEPVVIGRDLTYVFEVGNNGPDAAAPVVLTQELDASVVFTTATETGAVCNLVGNTLTCDFGILAANDVTSVTVLVQPTVAGLVGTTATVSSSITDPNPADNTVSFDSTVITPQIVFGSVSVVDGDNNGFIDGNECSDLQVTLENTGTFDALDISAYLSSSTPGVLVAQPVSGYPDIATSASAANTTAFKVTTTEEFVCGTTIELSLNVDTLDGDFVVPFSLESGMHVSASYDATTVPVTIPNSVGPGGNPDGWRYVDVPVEVSGLVGNIVEVTASLHISHDRVGEVLVELISPNGTTVTLTNNTGGNSDNYGTDCTESSRTIFADSAATLIGSGTAPYVGTFRPQESLSVLRGTPADDANGTWIVRVYDTHDHASNNGGTVECVSIGITEAICSAGNGICPATDIAITGSASHDPAAVTYPITYTFVLANNGNLDATTATASISVPVSATIDNVVATSGTTDVNSGVVTWVVAPLPAGESTTLEVTVTPGSTGVLSVTATADSDQLEYAPADNTAVVDVTVVVGTDLRIEKTGPATKRNYETFGYSITVTNDSSETATGVLVSDELPAEVDFVAVSSTQGTTSSVNGTVTVDLGTLEPATSATIEIEVTANQVGSAVNTATVGVDQPDFDLTNNSSTAVTAITPVADVEIVKTATEGVTPNGGIITYHLQVTNNGPDTVPNVQVQDAIPAGTEFVSTTSTQGLAFYNAGFDEARADLGEMAMGDTATVTVKVRATTQGPVVNTGEIANAAYDFDFANNASTTATVVIPGADVAVSVFNTPDPVQAGDDTSFTIHAINNGPDVATTTVLLFELPAELLLVSATSELSTCTIISTGVIECELGDLAAGSSVTLEVLASTTAVGTFDTTASITSETADPMVENNVFVEPITAAVANFGAVSASFVDADGDGRIEVEECATVMLTIQNTGVLDATSVTAALSSNTPGVVVTQPASDYPDLVVGENGVNLTAFEICTSSTFVCGTPINLSLTLVSNEGAGTVHFVGQATGLPIFYEQGTGPISVEIADANGNNPADHVSTQIPIEISGTYGNVTGVTVSLQITHPRSQDLILELTAPGASSPTVVLSDRNGGGQASDYGTSVTATTFDDAASISITNATHEAGFAAGTYQPEEALAAFIGRTGADLNGTWILTVTDTRIGDNIPAPTVNSVALGITTAYCGDVADLSVEKVSNVSEIKIGGNVIYTITVTNNGPDEAENVIVTDELISSTFVGGSVSVGSASETSGTVTAELGTLAAGSSATVTIEVTPTAAGTLPNTAAVSSDAADLNSADNSDTVEVTVTPLEIDLTVEKTADVSEVTIGGNVTYTITVTNAGPDDASAVTVTDILSSDATYVDASVSTGTVSESAGTVTAELGSIPVNGSATVTVIVTADAVGTLSNTASAASPAELDLNPADDTDSVDVTVNPLRADLTVVKTADVAEVAIGGNVTYTLLVTNNGPDAATSVTLTDAISTSATYVTASASTGSVTETSGVVTADLGNLASGTTATVTLTVTADAVGTLSNSATATATEEDINATNNTGSVDVTVNPLRADISLTKTADAASVVQGATITYTLTVTNNGPQTATNVVVTDTLDANATYVSSDTSAGTVSEVSGTVTALVGDLASGASATVTIVVTGDTIGTLNNSAAASADEQDLNSSNNTASVSVEVEDPAPVVDLVVGKSADQASVANGAAITYLITVYNAGPDDATSVTVLDPIDPSLTLVDVLPSQGDVEQINGTVSVDLGALAANTTATLEIVVQTGAAGQVLNSAFVTGAEADPVTDNNTDSVVVDVLAAADVRVSQTASRNPAALAEPFTFTVTVLNAGPDTATSVTLTDTLPAGATFGGATLSDGTYTVDSGVVTAEIGTLASGETATLTLSVTPQTTATLTNQASVSANEIDPVPSNNNSGLAVQVGSPFIPIVEDDFTTGTLDGTGGWVSFGFEIPGFANSEYDQAAGAYKAHIAPDPTRLRVAGVRAVGEALMPYSHVGPEKIVRAKYYLYAGGQSRTIDIPAIRLRAAIRFAQTSLLEVFTHTSLDPGVTPISTEMAPSSDPANPSLYRVDFDPVDVPSVVNNAATEGIMRAFEAYTTDVSDQGYVAMTESVLGTYAASSLPLTVAPIKVYAPAGGGAGNLSVNAGPGAFLTSATLIFGSEPGVPATVAPPSDGYSDYAEGAFGVTFDTTAVVADAVAVLTREFAPGDETTRVRVEEGKQYVVRFHATSTVPSEDNAMLNFRARSSKFSYTQRMILGGGHAASLANNQIAAESMPGIGTQNPDKDPGDITGGWYNVLVYTPLAKEIRPEFAPGTPLSTRMPDFTAEPGPGEAGASARDLRIGADIVDTLSRGFQYQLEQGHMTIDRIEVRSYDAIPD